MFAIILAGIYAAKQTRGALVVSVIFFFPAVAAWLGPDFLSEHLHMLLRLTTAAICFGVTSAVVLLSISQHQRVTRETILGGINVYLLLSFTFMMLHGTIMQIYPGADVLGGQPLNEHLDGIEDSHGFATLLYFSFTTMTTLGYGDIVPVDARARLLTSTQAVVGQLYVAIFMARLVSLEVSQRIRKS